MDETRIFSKNDPKAFLLRDAMEAYAALSESTWEQIVDACHLRSVKRKECLVSIGQGTKHFFFVCKGLLRAYTVSLDGKEYTKMFFPENTFPGSIKAAITGEPSTFALEALEDSLVIAIEHDRYRVLLKNLDDLKWYHIQYLEKNWILKKESLQVAFALDDAGARYERFVSENPELVGRVSLQHIASWLGITPTQLSRIRNLG
ncbi:Crp/Fnr family transcriptional regulator [Puniceicoccaceae bacterium K14]|nr:Crp/Fnr family transcriptional regulator [Puniceicoccaceae bacterium K14]